MTIVDSRQRKGTLTLDGTDFACQAKSVKIVPPEQGDDIPEEVLCGDPLTDDTEKPWKLEIVAIQDFADADGLVNTSWVQQGQDMPFVWQPQGATGPTYSGVVTIWPIQVGGEMVKRLESDASWRCAAKPVRTEAAGG